MAYWLIKSEPGSWSWDDHVRVGIEPWNGVRNYQACNNMKAMNIGDQAFFYHSVKEKQVVGIVEVCSEYYLDPSDESGRFGMVDFKAIKPVEKPVTLADIKAMPELEDMALVKQSRLSVCPVTDKEWKTILKMSRTKP